MLLKLVLGAIVLVLLLLLSVCGHFFLQLLHKRWRYRHLPNPKMKSFIAGNVTEINECEKAGGHFSMMISKWNKEYGSVFAVFLFNRAVVVCLEPSIVREMLINQRTSKPNGLYSLVQFVYGKRFAGYGLFSELDNDRWEMKRKMINPAFKRKYLVELMYQYNSSVQELITYLTPKADGRTKILMADEFNKVALDIIAKVAFSLNDLNVIAGDDSLLCDAAVQVLSGVIARARNPFMAFDLREKSSGVRRRTRDAIDLIRETGRKCILERIQDIKDGKDYPKDILTHILQASSALQGKMEYGLENMIDEFMTFLVAGQETTAQLMSFTFEMIGRHPDIYEKLQNEVDSVIGTKDSITYEDTCKLEYMNLVFKEVLRYTPPAAGVGRLAPDELVVNGHKIPAGTHILLNHYAMGRDERFFDDPETFNPERFRDETGKRAYAYFPFSLGPRICIGQHFAMIEAKVIIAKLLQKFDFTLVPGVELQFVAEVTLKSKHRTPIYLTPRKSHTAL